MKRSKLIVIFGVILILGLLVYFPGHNLARAHVNDKTAVTDHPLSCTSCHVYISRNKLIKKIVNEDYYSPFNLVVSNDGSRLFVVAQDSDELLVVDVEENEVLHKISVGVHPHSVILNKTGNLAYVSNQW